MFNPMSLIVEKLSILADKESFTEIQKGELHSLLMEMVTLPTGLSKWNVVKNFKIFNEQTKKVHTARLLFNKKYIEFGGNQEEIDKVNDDLTHQMLRLNPDLKKGLGKIKVK